MTKTSPIENRHKAPQAHKATAEILVGPIVPVLVKLALPTVSVLVVQTFVGVIETYFVSSLGASVLAGVSVVFPVLMLMLMMANGGIGSGLSSAIARASGAGLWGDAEAMVWHGVVIAGVTGVSFAAALIMGGFALYQLMGVSGPALSAALAYSSVLLWWVAVQCDDPGTGFRDGSRGRGYVEQAPAPSEEGEVLIIEVDGKATPTASQEELKQRRGPRQVKPSCPCGCQRHRGKIKRQSKKRKRRGKGRKDKNGRSITLVVMYTLKQGAEGKLHGPLNKKVWGSYAPRKKMLDWAREQATKRGFAPGTAQRIHIVVDGEKCLGNGLKERFAQASFALDIRHVEEKLWDMGRVLFKGEMDEVEAWVEERKSQLYGGQVEALSL